MTTTLGFEGVGQVWGFQQTTKMALSSYTDRREPNA